MGKTFLRGRTGRGEKGFTLIEILIVVTIIGIMSGIAIPAYIGSQEKAKRSTLLHSAKSAETDLAHWLSSALKGVAVGTPQTLLIEVDTSWDKALTNADMTNIALYNSLGSADRSVASVYAAARGAEFSPWTGMGGCGPTTLFSYNNVDPGPGNPGTACTIQLSPAVGSLGNRIAVIATSNGPGGADTLHAELLERIAVTAD